MERLRKMSWRSRLLLLLLFLIPPTVYFVLSGASEPSSSSGVDALAPVEAVAEGFKEPTGIVVDQTGAIFVAERKSGELFKITQGEIHPLLAGLKRPVGLAFDREGKLLIVEEKTGKLLRLESNGNLTTLAQGMKKPRWLALGEDEAIYLTAKGLGSAKDKDEEDGDEEESEVILRLTPHGSLVTVFAEGFKGLQGIVIDGGALFAAAKGLKKEKKDNAGIFKIPIQPNDAAGPITRLTKNEIKKPFGLVVDLLGALYVSAEEFTEAKKKVKDAIGKVAPDGTVTRFASNLKKPRGLAFDSSGNLYVADGKGDEHGRIVRLRSPPLPVVNVPAFTKQNPLTVADTTEPNSRIDAFLNDSTLPTTVQTKDGIFSLTLNLKPETQNFLEVFTTAHNGQGLTSAPAEFTIIHDDVAPLIANLQPPNGSFLNNAQPQIRADFSDNLSGVDVSRVEILLDGFPITSFTAAGFLFNPPLPLSEGQHTVLVTIADRAGNSASASSTFTIDTIQPQIANLTPAHGAVVTTARPLISADFSDSNSGINPDSVRITLDGVDHTQQAAITASGFTLDPPDLLQGDHTLFVSVSDRARNSAEAISTFTISLGPQLGRIGNRIVNLGETLTFTVTATGVGAVPPNLFVSPLPLPRNATFNAATGLFTFTPDKTQLGEASSSPSAPQAALNLFPRPSPSPCNLSEMGSPGSKAGFITSTNLPILSKMSS